MYAIIRGLLAVLLVATVFAPFACAQSQPTGIAVSETATINAKPDLAVVAFGVTTQDRDPNAAARANANATTSVIKTITEFGIPKKDIETIRYQVTPMMDYSKPGGPVITGYQVSNAVNVKERDLTKVGQLIDVGVKAGANNVQDVAFTIEEPSPIRSRALVEAIGKAKVKAQIIADNLGVKLGKVISASESVNFVPRPMEGPMFARAAQAAPTPILPGDVEVSATINVTYAIL